jgi:hypothetical protein
VVDDELGREERIDPGRLAAQVAHRIAHGGEVDDGRDAGEILEQDPRRSEGDLPVRLLTRLPFEDRPRLLRIALARESGANDVLKEHPERIRQPRDLLHRGGFVETRATRLCHPLRCYRRSRA